jgi:4-amino-4-deoxy-L-arabinose transferase-like glycosyltransferase
MGWRPASPAADPWRAGERRRALLLVVGACLALRLMLLVVAAPWRPSVEARVVLRADALGYHRLATTLLACGRFAPACDAPLETIRTPGYPALVAAVYALAGPHPWVLMVVHAAFDALAAVLLARTAARFFGTGAGLVAGVLYAIDPFVALYSTALLSESTFLLLLVAGMATVAWSTGAESARRQLGGAALAGGLLGLAILVRPAAQFLPPALATAYAIGWRRAPRRAVLAALAVLLVCGAVLTPWIARNQRAFGHASLSTVGAFVLALHVAPMEAELRGIDHDTAKRQLAAEADSLMRVDGLEPDADPFVKARYWRRLAMERVRERPLAFLRHSALGVVHAFGNLATSDFARLLGGEAQPVALKGETGLGAVVARFLADKHPLELALAAVLAPYLLITLAATVGGVVLAVRRRAALWFTAGCLAVALYFVVVSGAAGLARYRLPALPFYLPMTALGLMASRDAWHRWRRHRTAGAGT